MLTVILSLDYEIHGNGSGDSYELMVEPTERLLKLCDRYNAKVTIMADVAEILKFREHAETTRQDAYHYSAIVCQLSDAVRRGHDVQLHIHPSYFNARYENKSWVQDWSEYNLATLPEKRLEEVVRLGKQFLEETLKRADPAYECTVFRAANWAASPSPSLVRALIDNGIRIETSVFKWGRRQGIVEFDYAGAHSELVPWPVDEADICRYCHDGKLTEVPIYCERRWIGAFLSRNRIRRALFGARHSIPPRASTPISVSRRVGFAVERLLNLLALPLKRHAWKADFNQCTARQLCAALKRASIKFDFDGRNRLPFVLIGHSKLFTEANERDLAGFLEYVRTNPQAYRFGTYHDYQ